MSEQSKEGRYALGALTVLALWIFFVLPGIYYPAASATEIAVAQGGEASEFWPPVFGHRLKIMDTLVLFVTVGLFIANWRLWGATEKLVLGAEQTAEQQLRAYVYFKEAKATLVADSWRINYRIDNFGHTPAHNVRLLLKAKVVDWFDGKPVEIPIPDSTGSIETIGSMAPNGDFFEFDVPVDGSATLEDIKEGRKAVYLNGNIVYQIVFENRVRETNFRYYVGGDQGYDDSGEMSADTKGNDAS